MRKDFKSQNLIQLKKIRLGGNFIIVVYSKNGKAG